MLYSWKCHFCSNLSKKFLTNYQTQSVEPPTEFIASEVAQAWTTQIPEIASPVPKMKLSRFSHYRWIGNISEEITGLWY